MKRDPSPLVDLSAFQGGAVRPIGRGGIPPASAYSRIREANLGARSEGALSFYGDSGNNLLVVIF